MGARCPIASAALMLFLPCHTAAAQSVSTDVLAGAWEIVAVTSPDGRRGTQDGPPGLIIFTRSHYSITRVVLNGPRPHLDRPGALSAPVAALRALVQFVGEAGLYHARAGEIELHRVVSLFPKDTLPDTIAVFADRCDSQTLWLTSRTDAVGPVGLTLTLTRIE